MRQRQAEPKIEVVTVWYNRAYRVQESIGSILSQEMEGYRVIAVDDGSTDDTAARLKEMESVAAAAGVELLLWSKENQGFTRSLKRAIEEKSSAPYIALHGSGDISLPKRLSTLLAILEKNPSYAAAGCGVRVTGPGGDTLAVRQKEGVAERDLERGVIPKPCTHECTLIRRSAYEQIGGYRGFFRFAQDSDLWIRLSRVGEIVNTPEVLFEKVLIPESVSANWRKGVLQKKYSTLAIQNGLAVDRGEGDFIERIDHHEWQRAVDPVLFARRFHFGRRIYKAAKRGALGEAFGLSWEFLWTGASALRRALAGPPKL